MYEYSAAGRHYETVLSAVYESHHLCGPNLSNQLGETCHLNESSESVLRFYDVPISLVLN